MATSVTFGERLRIARDKAGLSKAELARKMAVEASTITRYEKNERSPRGNELAKIAKALEVTVESLMNDEPEAEPSPAASHVEDIIDAFQWPAEIEPEDAGAVVRQMREEHFKASEPLPMAYWATRMTRLVREIQGRAKDVHRRDTSVIADLNEESPEVRAGRKKPKRL